MLTVGDLKQVLEDIPDEAVVVFLSQPSWPFVYSISGTGDVQEVLQHECESDDYHGEGISFDEFMMIEDPLHSLLGSVFGRSQMDDMKEMIENGETPILYLTEGTQLRYATGGEAGLWNG